MANICYRYHNTLCPWQTPVAHRDSPFLIKSGYNPHHVLGNYYQPNGVGVSADTHLLLLPERVVRISRRWIHSAWNIMMTVTWEHVTPARAWGAFVRTQVTIPSIVDTRLLPLHQPMLCLKHWSNTNEALVCVRHCACDSDLGSQFYACPRWPQLTQAPSLFCRLCTEPYSGAHY